MIGVGWEGCGCVCVCVGGGGGGNKELSQVGNLAESNGNFLIWTLPHILPSNLQPLYILYLNEFLCYDFHVGRWLVRDWTLLRRKWLRIIKNDLPRRGGGGEGRKGGRGRDTA